MATALSGGAVADALSWLVTCWQGGVARRTCSTGRQTGAAGGLGQSDTSASQAVVVRSTQGTTTARVSRLSVLVWLHVAAALRYVLGSSQA